MREAQASPIGGEPEDREEIAGADAGNVGLVSKFQWPASVWFNLIPSAILGFVYASYVMGAALNPRNIGWLKGDAADYFIGWSLFRQDPHWHWPLAFTDRVGYPIGDSVALMDVNPLLAIVLKPFSSFLPDPFQYFGLEVILSCTLQAFFALKLFRLLLGSNPIVVVLPSLFVLISPIMALRMSAHYTLTNHWLLLAALFVFCLSHWGPSPISNRRFVASAIALAVISVAINPYIAFQVLAILSATVIGLLLVNRLALVAAAGVFVLLAASSIATAYIVGFLMPGGEGYAGGGYRFYSMNLLAPFDPGAYGALLFRTLPHFTDGQYEGYAYLGAGVMLIAVVGVLAMMIWRQRSPYQFKESAGMSLLLCCAALTLMALSTQISAGSKLLVDMDPEQILSPYLATLRSSGRMFWTPYYALLTAILAVPYFFFRRRWANLLLMAALVLQLADERPLHHWLHDGVNQPAAQPLQSPIWSKLGSSYQNLVIMPPYQCAPATDASPGGKESWVTFGLLAATQKMRTNSYNPGRLTRVSQQFHCVESISGLTQHRLSPESAYVVMPAVAAKIVDLGLGTCHLLDGFLLCSARDNFGLPPVNWTSEAHSWISGRFKSILLRDATPAETSEWTDAINRQGRSRVDLIEHLLTSGEFTRNSLPRLWAYTDAHGRWPTRAEWLASDSAQPVLASRNQRDVLITHDQRLALVYMLYFAILERDPDPAGVSSWMGALASTSVASVAGQFLDSPEYKERHPGPY